MYVNNKKYPSGLWLADEICNEPPVFSPGAYAGNAIPTAVGISDRFVGGRTMNVFLWLLLNFSLVGVYLYRPRFSKVVENDDAVSRRTLA